MSDDRTVQEINRELAVQINQEARRNPHSPYANKFVGIANGKVVVVADDPDEMSRRLRQIEPDPSKCFGVEASRDYSKVCEIWGVRLCRACYGHFGRIGRACRLSLPWH